jgi:putative phosphoesterase
MRILALYDIHGNVEALDAVLTDPRAADPDAIVIGGDVVPGRFAAEALERIAALEVPVHRVRGNGERESGDPALGAWPLTVVLDGVLFCHATPRDDEEVVLVDSRPARWAEVFAGLGGEITGVVCGHTHMPFARLVDRRTVINPGSVGMPYGGAGAHWALLGGPGQVSLRVTPFDLDDACARIAAESSYPGAAEFADFFVRSRASDLEALASFGPRDGR